MIKGVLKGFRTFARRMQKDHMGAYAATCAYFLMISFVPLFMVFLAFAHITGLDVETLTRGLVSIVPAGLKDYVTTITIEVTRRAYAYVPLSALILLWSAAKVFHALTNGLNVISRVRETRGWFFLRFRSMMYVLLLLLFAAIALLLSIFGQSIGESIGASFPAFGEFLGILYSFRSLIGYFGLIFVFLFIYKFLPNCHYTLKSQFPGALIVSTVWMFISYLLTLYYEHNDNFNNIYGSLTGIILAMIWLYFCCYFLLFGAELNRVLYEDPEGNVIVSTVDAFRDERARKRLLIMKELDEHSVWKTVDDDFESAGAQPQDIYIPWEDEKEPEEKKPQGRMFDDLLGTISYTAKGGSQNEQL